MMGHSLTLQTNQINELCPYCERATKILWRAPEGKEWGYDEKEDERAREAWMKKRLRKAREKREREESIMIDRKQ